MPDQPARRRRFQFRLRMLLTVVTLFCAACGYLTWLRQRASLRNELRGRIEDRRIGVVNEVGVMDGINIRRLQRGTNNGKVGIIRQWFGDLWASQIILRQSAADAQMVQQVLRLFPDTTVDLVDD